MLQFERHGIRWEALTPCEPLLNQLLADAGRPVKVTPTKLVTMHTIAGRAYFVKRYRNSEVPLRPLKFVFKESPARSEWNIAQQYVKLGIPLVHHVAMGERWTLTGLQESLLITEGFAGVSLSRGGPHQRADVQAALGTLLRLMHDRGVLQPDLHHNILVCADPLELRRVDVDQGQIKPALTDDERLHNLAWLNINVPLSDAFFQTYGATPEFIAETRRRSEIMRRTSRERLSWRSVGRNLRFEPQTIGHRKWWVRKEFFDDRLQRQLENPDQPVEGFHVQPFARAGIFGETAALRAYRTAYHLELLGLPTPRPLAATRQFFVTEQFADAGVELPDVAPLLARLHAEGFSFGGKVSSRNFRRQANGAVFVIELENLRFQKAVDGEADARALGGEVFLQLYRAAISHRQESVRPAE